MDRSQISELESSDSDTLEQNDDAKREELYHKISQRFKFLQPRDFDEYCVPQEQRTESIHSGRILPLSRFDAEGFERNVHQPVKVHHQYFEKIRSLHKSSRNVKYTLYCHSSIPLGWSEHAKGVKYLHQLHWSESLLEKLPPFAAHYEMVMESPFQFSIQKTDNDLGLFTEMSIVGGACLGEYTGEVTENRTFKKYSYQLFDDYEVDASDFGNEFRFIRDSFLSRCEPNVRLEQMDGHIFVVANRGIL